MTTLTFDFNMEEMEKRGYTVDEFMQPIREVLKNEEDITETKPFLFVGNGEDVACCFISTIIDVDEQNPDFIYVVKSAILSIDNEEIEDCVGELREIHEKERKNIA